MTNPNHNKTFLKSRVILHIAFYACEIDLSLQHQFVKLALHFLANNKNIYADTSSFGIVTYKIDL